MYKQVGKVGTIRREVLGKACRFCGGRTYQLIIKLTGVKDSAGLSARCSHCQRSRKVSDDVGRILWM